MNEEQYKKYCVYMEGLRAQEPSFFYGLGMANASNICLPDMSALENTVTPKFITDKLWNEDIQ